MHISTVRSILISEKINLKKKYVFEFEKMWSKMWSLLSKSKASHWQDKTTTMKKRKKTAQASTWLNTGGLGQPLPFRKTFGDPQKGGLPYIAYNTQLQATCSGFLDQA